VLAHPRHKLVAGLRLSFGVPHLVSHHESLQSTTNSVPDQPGPGNPLTRLVPVTDTPEDHVSAVSYRLDTPGRSGREQPWGLRPHGRFPHVPGIVVSGSMETARVRPRVGNDVQVEVLDGRAAEAE